MNVAPSQFDLMKAAMDFTTLAKKAASQNIANVNTPHYQAVEAQLSSAESMVELVQQSKSDDKPFALVATNDTTLRNDGNNVDIDREVGRLNKSALLFRTYTQLLSQRLSQMRNAIQLG